MILMMIAQYKDNDDHHNYKGLGGAGRVPLSPADLSYNLQYTHTHPHRYLASTSSFFRISDSAKDFSFLKSWIPPQLETCFVGRNPQRQLQFQILPITSNKSAL